MTRFASLVALAVGVLLLIVGGIGVVVGVFGPGRGDLAVVFAVVAAVGGVVTGFAVRGLLRTKPIGSPAAGAKYGPYQLGTPEERDLAGNAYEVFVRPAGHKNNPPAALIVRAATPPGPVIHFRGETWFDRLGKRLGIAREFETGDEAFDRAVYVRGRSDAFAEAYLREPARPAAVLALRDLGFRDVRLTGTHAQAEWPGFDPNRHDSPELADRAAAAVLVLAAGVPADPDPDAGRADPRDVWHVLLWAAAGLSAPLIVCVWAFPAVRPWSLVAAGAVAFAVVYPLFGLAAALLLRGTSTAHDRWATLMIVGVGLLALGCGGGAAAVNGLADAGPPTVHSAVVTDKRIKTGKRNAKTHLVQVADWGRPGGVVEYRVSESVFARMVPSKSRVDVTTRPGFLGVEWETGRQDVP